MKLVAYIVRQKDDPNDYFEWGFFTFKTDAERDCKTRSDKANQQDGGYHTEPMYEVVPLYENNA